MPITKIDKSEHEKIIQLYNDGLSLRKIAEIYNVSKGTISGIVPNELKSKRANINKISKEDEDEIISIYLSCYSISKVIRRTNWSRNTIIKVLKDLRITRQGFILEDEKDNIIKLYKEGHSFAKIGEKYNTNRNTIHKIISHFDEDVIRGYDEYRTHDILNYFNEEQLELVKKFGNLYEDRNEIAIRHKDKSVFVKILKNVYLDENIDYVIKNARFHDGAYIISIISKNLTAYTKEKLDKN